MPKKKAKIEEWEEVIQAVCTCPYCGATDDYEFWSDVRSEEDCTNCEKTFIVDLKTTWE